VGEPTDLLVGDGRIGQIGPDAGTLPHRERGGLRRVELDGRIVIPGLWDHHVHSTQAALRMRQLDISEAGSAAAAAQLVGARLAAGHDPAEPLVGHGFRDGLWNDAPHLSLLDAVAPAGASSVAVVLCSGDLHCGWLNSAALRRYGLESHATGVLREDEWYPVMRRATALDPRILDREVATLARQAAARGVVGIVEYEQAPNLDDWSRRVANGCSVLRVVCGVYEPQLEAALDAGLHTGQVLADTDGLVRMGSLKVVTDGSLNTRTAYCHDAYPGETGPQARGVLVVPPAQLVTLMDRAMTAGIHSAIHAIGDRANELALDAFAQTGASGTIEHAQLLATRDIPRLAALGVTASVQPAHLLDDRPVAEAYWPRRTDRVFAFADLLAAGARVVFGSDAPVAPLDPWLAMSAAVFRARAGEPPWHPEQKVGVADALAASTAAGRGVRTGDRSDLAIVECDPFAADAEQLAQMPVWATMLGGRFTWSADGSLPVHELVERSRG
jgi:predicted amidohydrolase YtcJ